MFKNRVKKIHFVGIGGVGMSGIAEVLKNMGFYISGSDIKKSFYTEKLEKLGCEIKYKHDRNNLKDVDVVVYSSAIKPDNPEIVEAKKRGIIVIKRAEMLAELMRMKFSILISGSHGKTTTTSMCGILLHLAGLDPTIVIGGKLNIFGGNVKMGYGEYLVAEADESDGSFLKLFPTIAILTNIDREHVWFYGSFERLMNSFVEFTNRVPFYGAVILCNEDENIKKIKNKIDRKKITYGFDKNSHVFAHDISPLGYGYSFKVNYNGKYIGEFKTKVPGKHNVLNGLAMISLALEMGIDMETVKKSFEIFSGVDRRFQIKGIKRGITIIDDYAHHPTEIKATFETIKNMSPERVIAIFQPHRYSRIKELYSEFIKSFSFPDILYCTEIYSAGETEKAGLKETEFFKDIKEERKGKETYFLSDMEKIVKDVLSIVKPGDLIITLGAGNVYKIGEKILEKL